MYIDRQDLTVTPAPIKGTYAIEHPNMEKVSIVAAENLCQAVEAFENEHEAITFLGFCPACGYDRDSGRTVDEYEAAAEYDEYAAEVGSDNREGLPEFNGAFNRW